MQTGHQVEITKTELKTTRRTPARRLLATSVESEFAVNPQTQSPFALHAPIQWAI